MCVSGGGGCTEEGGVLSMCGLRRSSSPWGSVFKWSPCPSHSICGQQFKQNTEGTGRNSRQAKLCCLCASRFWNQLVQSPKPPCSAHAPLVTCFPSLSRVSARASHARAPAGRTHQRVPLPGRPRSLRGFFLGQTCHPFLGLSSTCPLHLKDK